MLVRPMLFPTTPMISVSTNKIKKYTLFCYFKSEASSWFWFPQTTIKNILYYYYSCYHYYSYSYSYYFSFYFILFFLQIKSKSMSLVFTNKNKTMLYFFTKSMFSVSTDKNKNMLQFFCQVHDFSFHKQK